VRIGWTLAVVGASVALLALLVFGVASTGDDTAIEDALADGIRPAAVTASLPVLGEEGEGSLADYGGEVVVLNFWASWCPPCVDELPLLEDLQRSLRGHDATVLGVNYQDLPEDALEFARDYELSYSSLRDIDGEYAEEYGTLGMPETFLIDRQGRVAAYRRGPIDQRWLNEELPPLLAEE
jgi:cytochrome c biogenesis protein CcmG/thiol:disulfide interchange protein DsbE